MASKKHKKLVGLIARKMRQKGYKIISLDGNGQNISNISLNAPPFIKKHRPDLIGLNFSNNKLCIGEAKTQSDLNSMRTKEQFLDFSGIIPQGYQAIEFIIGIPKSAENKLVKLLQKLNILNKLNISYVWMPDEFLIDEEENL